MMLVPHFQNWRNCAPDTDRARLSPQNLEDEPEFLGAQILDYKYEKNLDLQVFSRLGVTMKELQSISNRSLLVIF